ncbi:MAG TPA: GNAT family N-acetyltransferase [bacterium]|jgi:GNAT superfamily N-acetyltransferase
MAKAKDISSISVYSTTSDRWLDIEKIFEGHGDRGCWCQYYRHSSSDYGKGGPGSGRKQLKQQVENGPTPGMIACADGEPAGWLGFWPREKFERLVPSKKIPKIDDKPVWSVVCFMVRVGYRRSGIAKALLEGTVEFARENNIPILEAYPIDSEGERVDVSFAYVGFTHLFEAAGFKRVAETNSRSAKRKRILMRLEL